MHLPQKTLVRITIVLLVVNTLCVALIIIHKVRHSGDFSSRISRDNNAAYQFTNPILDCENVQKMSSGQLQYKEAEEAISALTKKFSISYASVYFRDLNNGPWIGVNEKESFAPASLLKVPLLISFLKQAQDDQSFLQKKVTVTERDVSILKQEIPPLITVEVGKTYTLLEIAMLMVQQSDNTARNIIAREVKDSYVLDLYRTVGATYETDDSNNLVITTKDYAAFFRVLFNASYLNRSMSEKALQILSHTSYENGIVRGIDNPAIAISHKFGEREVDGFEQGLDMGNTVQVHDCGIVYYPDKPYVLCVMTRDNDIKTQERFIQAVSQYFYQHIK